MALPALPAWVGWLLLAAVILLFLWVGALSSLLRRMSSGAIPRNRTDLETLYGTGSISRDDYDWWKNRLQG